MKIKPTIPGTVIYDMVTPDPATWRRLPDEGAEVADSSFWRRRLMAGEVVLVNELEPSAAAASAAQPHKE